MRAFDFEDWDDEDETSGGGVGSLLLGVGLGVGLMYLLDPDRGAQRRSWMKDKAVHWQHQIKDVSAKTSRDVAQRTRGLVARTRLAFQKETDVPDLKLIERVRAAMGRKVSHPRAIVVDANDGIVTLAGPVLAEEVDRLLATVAKVRGVQGIENELEVHSAPYGVPELQGDVGPRTGTPNLWMRTWPPATRLWAGVGGLGLLAFGLPRRTVGGYASGIAGTALLLRALTNSPQILPARGGRDEQGSQEDEQDFGEEGSRDEGEIAEPAFDARS